MPAQDTATFAVYSDRLSTANAIERLRAAGFRNTDIVALFPDEIGTWQFSQRKRRGHLRKAVVAGLILGALVAIVAGIWLAAGTAGTLLGAVVLAAGGSFIGAFTTAHTENYQERYEGRVRHGDILVTVHADSPQWAERAKEILRKTGGDDVSTSDKVVIDFISNRILVRPASEKSASPLRLVTPQSTRLEVPRSFGGATPQVPRDQPRRV